MKKTLKIIVLMGLIIMIENPIISQNLVPNSSFETYTSCPTGTGQITLAAPWTNPTTGSSDYLNACSGGIVDVPINNFGIQTANTGNAYAHISTGIPGWAFREYIQVQLTSPLISGQNYQIQFYVSLAEGMNAASNNIGAYLSSTAPSLGSAGVLPFVPQINYNTVLQDSVNWTLISGFYTALGGEEFITIGNFYDDLNTTFSLFDSVSIMYVASYYIDDVSVTPMMPPPSSCLIDNDFESQIFTNCGGSPDLQTNGSQSLGITQIAAVNNRFLGFHPTIGFPAPPSQPTVPFEYVSVPLSTPMVVGNNYTLSFYHGIAKLNGAAGLWWWVSNNLGDKPGLIEVWAGNAACDTSELIYTSSVVNDESVGWVFESANYTASAAYTYLTLIPLGIDTGENAPYVILDKLLFCESFLPPPSGQCDTLCGPNLAPNPGFENTTINCANNVSEIFTDYSQVQNWLGTACSTCPGNGSTPDYNNSLCNGPSQTNTCDGSNGSLGFFTFALGAGTNAREYVQAQLITPLTAGMEYCVSIDAKSATGSAAYDRNDGLGIWFTNQMVDIDLQNGGQQFIGPSSMINATPQVENPSGNIIDTVCQTITGTFTATGTEQWVVIGNFRNDVSTNTAGDCSFLCVGYMNIDNISIRTSCNNTPLPLDLQLSTTIDTICEGSCTTLSASVTGGTSPYVITWNNGLPNGNGPHNVCPTTTTTYTAIVTDSLNDTDTSSITIYVNPTDSNYSAVTICANDSVFAGGNWQNTTGMYYDTLQNTYGCDSLLVTDLTVNPTVTNTDVKTACNSFNWIDGNTYNASTTIPTFTIVGGAANGCDSIVTLNLTINTFASGTDVITSCTPITWIDGNTYSASTTTPKDTIVGGSFQGCDSIVTLNLTISSAATGTDIITSCVPTTWIDGNTYSADTTTPTFTIVGGAANGCDSIVTLNLTITPAVMGTDIITSCSPITWLDGNTYSANTTTPTFTIVGGAANGCDSIVTLNLTITPAVTSTDIITSCVPITWLDGNTYSANTTTPTFTIVGGAANSCDSIVTLNLTITPAVTGTDIITSCSPITWLDGNIYSANTTTPTFTIVGGAANGCDSIVTLNLTITTPTTTTNVYNECEGFSVVVGTNTYSTTGIFTDIINNCDTIITDLTINPAPQVTLIKTDDNCGEEIGSVTAIATSNNPPITYIWNTGSNDSIISNLPAGLYSVIVNDGSGCAKADTINIAELQIDCDYFVYTPNAFTPNGDGNNDVFYVRGKGIESLSVNIYNRWGNKVFEINNIAQGWDGTYKGAEQNTAVFVFVLEATFLNGKTVSESGDVSLIR